MESTQSKLQKLRTTWQSVYQDMIIDDEINDGIDAVTDLVQVLDNFVASFGGGIKTIVGFGAIVANIFNKQIAEGINNAINRQQVYQQNLDALKLKQEVFKEGSKTGNTDYDKALEANTNKQIEYAEKIYQFRVGLNSEQYNTLTGYQQEIGKLEEQLSLLESSVATEANILSNEEDREVILTGSFDQIQDILKVEEATYELKQKDIKNLNQQVKEADKLLEKYVDIEEIENAMNSSSLSDASKSNISNILEQNKKGLITLEEAHEQIIEVINNEGAVLEEEQAVYNKEILTLQKILKLKQKGLELTEDQSNIKQQADAMLELAKNATLTTANITAVTSALGNMAMTFSSISSLTDIWTSEADAGSKVLQTITTLSMAIPMYISSMQKLKEISEGVAAAKEAERVALLLTKAARDKATLSEMNELTSKLATKTVSEEQLKEYAKEILIKQLDQKQTETLTEKEIVELTIGKENIRRLTQEQLAYLKIAASKKIATKETEEATIAQKGFNLAQKASPLGIVISLLMAATVAFTLYTKIVKESREKLQEFNKSQIEANNTKIEEIKENEQLANSYEDLAEQYRKGSLSKMEFAKETEELIDKYDIENGKILALTGQYEALGKAISNARKAQLEEANKLVESNNKYNVVNAQIANAEKKTVYNPLFGKKTDSKASFTYGGDFGIGDEDSLSTRAFHTAGSLLYQGVDIFGSGINSTFKKDIIPTSKDLFFQEPVAKIEGDLSTPEGIVEYYNKLTEARKTASGDYAAQLQAEIERYETYYQQAISDFDIAAQSKIGESFFENEDIFSDSTLNYDTFLKKYNEALEKTKRKLDVLKGAGHISEEEYNQRLKASQNYLDSLVGQYDQAYKLLAEKEQIESIEKIFEEKGTNKEWIKEWLNKNIYDDKEKGLRIAAYLDINGDETENILNAKYEKAKLEDEKNQRTERIEKFETARNLVVEGKDQEAIQEALSGLQDLENGYTNLYGIQEEGNARLLDIINDYYNVELDHIRETTETSIEANNKIIEEYQKRLEILKAQDLSLLSEKDKEKTLAEIAEIEVEIKNLTSENYEIQLSISDEITDKLVAMADNVVALSGAMADAAEGIGENFTVAADGVQKLADTFPELFEGAEVLENGVVQLKEETVKAVLDADAEMLASDDELVKNKIKNRIKELDIKIDETNKQIKIAQKVADGEITISEAEKEAKEANVEGFGNFLVEQYNSWLEDHAKTNAAKATDHHEMIKSMIEDVNKLGAAWTQFEESRISGTEYIATEIDDEASYTGGDFEEIVSSINEDNLKAIKDATDQATEQAKAFAKAAVESLTAQRDSDEQNRAQLYAALAELEAKSDDADRKMKNAISGKGNKDKKEKEKKNDDEFDRYWEIKKAIDAVDRALNKLAKDQENLYGDELADSLMQTNQLLEQQAANYRTLAEEQKKEAVELQGVLGGMGVAFDASGAITNYAAATSAALAEYNEAIAKYNAGLLDESSFKIYEQQYELFKKQLERYDQLFYTEMKETQEKLEEIERQKKANNLKAWQVKLEVKLEMKELKREWNDFLNEINSDFKSVYKDLRAEVDTMKKNAKTYGGKDGTINTEIDAIKHVEKEIDKMKSGGTSSEYESISQAQEKLKELNQKLLTDAKDFHDLVVQAWEAYYEGIDQVKDQLDFIIDRYEKINDNLEYQKQLVELLYGPEAYDMMNTWYQTAEYNSLAQIEAIRTQRDTWKELFDTALSESGASMNDVSTWNKDLLKFYENWQEAEKSLRDATIADLQLIKDAKENSINASMKELENSLTGGKGLSQLKYEWEKAKAASDKYFDGVETKYQIQTFANKVDSAIADQTSIKAQQKLNRLKQEEVDTLKEKNKLTKTDLEYANARLKIAEAEIALEDAQNNKNSMKVVRNEEGNWSYQYVADEEDIATKRQELLDSYNELYEIAKKAREEGLQSILDLTEDYLNRKKEIALDETLTDEQKNKLLSDLDNEYYTELDQLQTEVAEHGQVMTEAGAMLQLTAYEQDHEVYGELTEEKKKMFEDMIKNGWDKDFEGFHITWKETGKNMNDEMDKILGDIKKDFNDTMTQTLPVWTTGAQTIVDLFAKDDGKSVKSAITKSYEDIQTANENYSKSISKLEQAAGISFDNLEQQIIANTDATNDLEGAMQEACDNGVDYIDELRDAAEELEEAWNAVKEAIEDAIRELEEYLQIRGKAGAGSADGITSAPIGGGAAKVGSSGGNANKDEESKSPGDSSEKGEYVERFIYGQHSQRVLTGAGKMTYGQAMMYALKNNETGDSSLKIGKGYMKEYWVAPGLKSGGYTGSWSGADTEENGKLAMLHQKELVLNADDTKNLLDAVGIVRALGDFISATTAGLSRTSASTISNSSISSNSSNYGDVIINAEFPNASDVEDIREAILSLPNLAAQYFANQNNVR